MKVCPNCQKEVPEYSTKCKYCDYKFFANEEVVKESKDPKSKRKSNGTNKTILVILGLICVVAVFYLYWSLFGPIFKGQNLSAAKVTETPSITYKKIEAWTICKQFITDQLKAPSTAEFEWADVNKVTIETDDTYSMEIYVDAENSFGTMLRTYLFCRVMDLGDTWQLVDVEVKK